MKKFYIVYDYFSIDHTKGVAACFLDLHFNIDSEQNLKTIEQAIKLKYKHKDIVIINWKKL